MTYFQKRRMRKYVKHLLREAAHARNMREDVAQEENLRKLQECETELIAAFQSGNHENMDELCNRLHSATRSLYPVRRYPGLRENIEVIAVALAVAMAFRSYFVQPFKIPTSSMSPTLYGIHYVQVEHPGLFDRLPLKLLKAAITGRWYVEVRAKQGGVVQAGLDPRTRDLYFLINGEKHKFSPEMKRFVSPGSVVTKGQLLASGMRVCGDHIFVNKVIWNLREPKRGEVMVFRTDDIDYPGMKNNLHYVKRMVGIPGDNISIDPPYVNLDGQAITNPPSILRVSSQQEPGYNSGYLIPPRQNSQRTPLISSTEDVVHLDSNRYLAFGDNQASSFDSRIWGTVNKDSLLGPAFFVYWPFGPHWGPID